MVRAFEAVGRLSSMRKAADELAVCHTVVSRHVRNLKAWFGGGWSNAARAHPADRRGRIFLRSVSSAFDLM